MLLITFLLLLGAAKTPGAHFSTAGSFLFALGLTSGAAMFLAIYLGLSTTLVIGGLLYGCALLSVFLSPLRVSVNWYRDSATGQAT